jgi:hypothetical protein
LTLLDLLSKAAGLAGPELEALLSRIEVELPDFAPLARKWLDALHTGVAHDNLVAVGKAVVTELGDIAQGKTDGKIHPSDMPI